MTDSPSPSVENTIPALGACVLNKLIHGQSVNGYADRLSPDWLEIYRAVEATPPTPSQRNAAFEAAIANRQDHAAIRAAVFAADLGADLESLLPQPPPDLDAVEIPELPNAARIDPALSMGVCTWLDDYIAFSRKWSPRAFDSFHVACALWLLSTIAARRVCVHMGKERFPNLYIALTARTSLYAKSSTAEIASQLIRQVGADWLLAADSATPQKFVADLTSHLPQDYDDIDLTQQERARLRAGMAGQRGWYYDEFGQHIAAMLREGGFMSDFRGLIRRMDDTPTRYEYGTISRGSDIVEHPYLALLANMTPDDLKPFAKKGAGLWGDGFLARFALITPPKGERLKDRFPQGERKLPDDLVKPVAAWHRRLGFPNVEIVEITNDKGEKTGRRLEVSPRLPVTLNVANDVFEAFYNYHDGLLDIVDKSDNHDLDGNYARLAEKALRVALLLTSFDDKTEITLPYWARAQAITEEWRAGLHRLYCEINEPSPSKDQENEEKLLQAITRHEPCTAAQAARFVRGLSSGEAARLLDGMVSAGLLQANKTQSKTNRYELSKIP